MRRPYYNLKQSSNRIDSFFWYRYATAHQYTAGRSG